MGGVLRPGPQVVGPSATATLLAVLTASVGDSAVVDADEAEISSDEDDVGRRGAGAGAGRGAVRSQPAHEETAVQAVQEAGGSVADAVQNALEAGADPNAVDADCNAALYLAAHVRSEETATACVRSLLKAAAEPNARRRGGTPLNFALERGSARLVQLLLGNGGYPLRRLAGPGEKLPAARRRLLPFAQAAGHGDEARRALVRRLNDALLAGQVAVVEGLVFHGCPVNRADDGGRTPLLQAIAHNCDAAVVTALLDGGARADVRDASGTHALALPIMRNDAPVVRALLKYRANPLATEDGVRLDAFAQRTCSDREVLRLINACTAHALGARTRTEPGARTGPSPAAAPASAVPALSHPTPTRVSGPLLAPQRDGGPRKASSPSPQGGVRGRQLTQVPAPARPSFSEVASGGSSEEAAPNDAFAFR